MSTERLSLVRCPDCNLRTPCACSVWPPKQLESEVEKAESPKLSFGAGCHSTPTKAIGATQ